jgi:hypothetical protein
MRPVARVQAKETTCLLELEIDELTGLLLERSSKKDDGDCTSRDAE